MRVIYRFVALDSGWSIFQGKLQYEKQKNGIIVCSDNYSVFPKTKSPSASFKISSEMKDYQFYKEAAADVVLQSFVVYYFFLCGSLIHKTLNFIL